MAFFALDVSVGIGQNESCLHSVVEAFYINGVQFGIAALVFGVARQAVFFYIAMKPNFKCHSFRDLLVALQTALCRNFWRFFVALPAVIWSIERGMRLSKGAKRLLLNCCSDDGMQAQQKSDGKAH